MRLPRRAPRLLLSALAFLAIAGLAAPRALALDARSAEDITIPAGQTIDDDLYVAAKTVDISGTVQGDVIAVAQTIHIEPGASIEGSLVAVAQTIVIEGSVRDSARIAAQVVQIGSAGNVGRDLLGAAQSIEGRSGSTVGRDLAVVAQQALLAGTVGRNVKAAAEGFDLRGGIGGDADLNVGANTEDTERGEAASAFAPTPVVPMPSVANGLAVASGAHIDGHLGYESVREYPIAGTVGRGVTWTERKVEAKAEPTAADAAADVVRHLMMVGLIGCLILWLAPRALPILARTIETRPLPSLGWGLIAIMSAVAIAIGILISMLILTGAFGVMTLGGLVAVTVALGILGEGALTVGVILFCSLIAQAVASYTLGELVLGRLNRGGAGTRRHQWLYLLLGLPIIVILRVIPVVGGLLAVLVGTVALGALWIAVRDRNATRPVAPPLGDAPGPEPSPIG